MEWIHRIKTLVKSNLREQISKAKDPLTKINAFIEQFILQKDIIHKEKNTIHLQIAQHRVEIDAFQKQMIELESKAEKAILSNSEQQAKQYLKEQALIEAEYKKAIEVVTESENMMNELNELDQSLGDQIKELHSHRSTYQKGMILQNPDPLKDEEDELEQKFKQLEEFSKEKLDHLKNKPN